MILQSNICLYIAKYKSVFADYINGYHLWEIGCGLKGGKEN